MRARVRGTDPLLLVSAAHPMPEDVRPELTGADENWPQVLLERQAARLLAACIQAVAGKGQIVPVSGWRSREEQQQIWDDTMKTEGERFTRQYVALPGCSEHQTGLAIDLGLAAPHIDFIRPDFPDTGVCGAFKEQAGNYGFILRYPAGKEHITGIAHEPWHFRYVGAPHGAIMTRLGLTLEEYLELLDDYPDRDRPFRFRMGEYHFAICRLPEDCPEEELPQGEGGWQRSRDNRGGLIVTTWSRER